MPALPNVPKAIRIVERFTMTGIVKPIINSFHWGYATGDISAVDLLSFVNTWATAWGANLPSRFTTALELAEVIGTSLSSATAPVASVSPAIAGTNGGVPVPAGTSLVMQRPVGRRYRGGHSRVYRAGIPYAGLLNPDEWDPAYTAVYITDHQAFESAVVAGAPSGYGAFAPINISYYEGFTPFLEPSGRYRNIPKLRTTPLVDAIIGIGVNPRPASQRRRNGQSS